MAGKRQATNNLNHDNWDQEEEPEEPGTYKKATEEELQNRVIKKARRRVTGDNSSDSEQPKKNVFQGFTGFATTTNTGGSSPFAFLNKIAAPNAAAAFGAEKPAANAASPFSATTAAKTLTAEDKTDSITASVTKNANFKSANFVHKLRELNHSVCDWIQTHLNKNDVCILRPIFNDYEMHLQKLEEEEAQSTAKVVNKSDKEPTSSIANFKFGDSSSTTAPAVSAGFSFGTSVPTATTAAAVPAVSTGTFSFGLANKTTAATSSTSTNGFCFSTAASGSKPAASISTGFSFGAATAAPSNENKPTFSFGSGASNESKPTFSFGAAASNENKPTFSFGAAASNENKPAFSFVSPSATTFSFGNIAPSSSNASTSGTAQSGNKSEDENDGDEPPKVEFKKVEENDAVYSQKCKVFVKKGDNYAERGVGTLYLKPIKDSEKTQLIVRADTNLGNILLNCILSDAIPAKRMGKNNVMIVCPEPEQDKPIYNLLRVKSGEDADELLAQIEKYKK